MFAKKYPLFSVAIVAIFMASCGVPTHMQVETNNDPENRDLDVRFRTTYYFRVFDFCYNRSQRNASSNPNAEYNIIPETDTLYRYRMTGKAHSLWQNVKFESGTLQDYQIDPFGTDVVYDDSINGFRVRSYEEGEKEALRAKDLDTYRQLYGLWEASKENGALQASSTQLETAMQQVLNRYIASLGGAPDRSQSAEAEEITLTTSGEKHKPLDARSRFMLRQTLDQEITGEATVTQDEGSDPKLTLEDIVITTEKVERQGLHTQSSIVCPNNAPHVNRGFQILGPAGWRTFLQSERLILAMYTDAEPLISTMAAYSDRILNAKIEPTSALLPLVREQLKVVEAEREADRISAEPSSEVTDVVIESVYSRVLDKFGSGAVQ